MKKNNRKVVIELEKEEKQIDLRQIAVAFAKQIKERGLKRD